MAAIAYPTRSRGGAVRAPGPYDDQADRSKHLRLIDPSEPVTVPAGTRRPGPRHRETRALGHLLRQLRAGALTLGLLLGCWFGASALVGARPSHFDPPSGATAVTGGYRYVVRAGDTLWSIASAYEPNADPRPLVDALQAQLRGGVLEPGDVLRLPS